MNLTEKIFKLELNADFDDQATIQCLALTIGEF